MSSDTDKNIQKKIPLDDMALRLATARTSDTHGEVIFPITTNITADAEVVDPEEERNLDFDSGA